jgi:tRNA A37 methylthiotransferase MiaB
MTKADTERTLRETTLDRQGDVTYVVPGCYCCTKDQNQRESQSVHFPFFDQTEYERAIKIIRQIHPPKKTQEEIDRIRSYVPQEVQERQGTMVSPRVRILALQMIENYFKTLKQ